MPIPVQLPRSPVRPRGLLLDAAQQIPESAYEGRNGATRWILDGVTWNPPMYLRAEAEESNCAAVYDKQPTALEGPVEQPAFLLWQSLQCSRLSNVQDLLDGELTQSLDVLVSAAFAAELEAATASGGLGLIGSAEFAPEVVTVGVTSLATVIAELEEYLADALEGAVGMIHLTAGLLTLAVAQDLVFWDGSVYRTHTGHIVVGDAGHSGVPAPEGEDPADPGEAWVYATDIVFYDQTGVKDSESHGVDPGGFDFAHNVDMPLKERHGILVFNPLVLAAGLVSTAAASSGAELPPGAATDTNQGLALDALDNIWQSVNGLEGLLAEPTLVLEAFTADETIAAANYFHGFTIKETSGSAAATVSIHHGNDSSDPVISFINLAEGESVPLTVLHRRVAVPDGIHVEVLTGAVSGVIVYEA